MIRRLSGDDRKLWEILRKSVRPLRPAPKPAPKPAVEPEPRTEPNPVLPKSGYPPPPPGPTPPKARPGPPPLIALEERVRRRLARGVLEADARIDLHGMRQDRAFTVLMSFLRRSQARGARLVLVITGKGKAEGDGILRQSVPAWLSRPEFRDLVIGFEEAGRRQGGAGALYVRLRRRRDVSNPGAADPP